MVKVKSKALLQGYKSLLMQPELAKKIGTPATFLLQQIHYWTENSQVEGKIHQGRKWIANSYNAWAKDLELFSISTVNRSIKKLKDSRLIFVEKLSCYKSNRTNWYAINYERLEELLGVPTKADLSCHKQEHGNTNLGFDQGDLNPLKLSESSTQNELFYNDKITNKEILNNPIKSDKSEISKNISSQEKPISQQMLDIWNEYINPQVTAQLTKERCKLLIAALKYKFQNNLEGWKSYCLKLCSSDYLMGKIGKGFKLVLDIALKFSFIQQIVENGFGVKETVTPVCSKEQLDEELNNPNESKDLQELRRKIYEKVGQGTYLSWFKEAAFFLNASEVKVITQTHFKKDWIEKHYQNLLGEISGRSVSVVLKPC